MRRFATVLICAGSLCGTVLLWAAAGLSASQAPPLDVASLTRIASKLSGLPAKRPVPVVVQSGAVFEAQWLRLLDQAYPPSEQTYDETMYRALGLLRPSETLRVALAVGAKEAIAVYDPVGRKLYARAGNASVRQSVLVSLVEALEDQSFDTRRVSALARANRDSGLAATAAVQGSAALSVEVLGGRTISVGRRATTSVRRPQSHDSHEGSRIALFLQLERAFPSTTGLRFVAALQNVGGRQAVLGALKRFPDTTEQVFHLDAFLARKPARAIELAASASGFTLQHSDTFGELDVRALLAIFQIPRLDHVGAGWGGGLSAVYRGPGGSTAVALRLDWDTDLDAAQWAEAVYTYVNEAFDADVPGFPPTTVCSATACWKVAGHNVALARAGTHTALVLGPSVAAASTLASALVPS